METDPHRWIVALRQSHNRLASLVQPLTPEQLRSPSYHSWSLAEVVGHLGSQAEISAPMLTAAVEHTDPPGFEFMQPIWDVWNAKTPEEQAADGLVADERYVQRFESLTDDELARMHLHLMGMELDSTGLARLRLGEHAIHTWDIAVALDHEALVSPDAVTLLIDGLGPLAHRTGKPQGKNFHLHVHTTQPERDFALKVDDEVAITDWENSEVDGDMHIPAEAFLRLVYGRLDAKHAPAVDITAPNVSLDDVRAVFPGF